MEFIQYLKPLDYLILAAAGIVFLIIGIIIGSAVRKRVAERQIGSAEQEATRLINDAIRSGESRKKEMLLEAKDEIHDLNKKIRKIDEERVAIFKELDYKNKMILAYNVELNKSILNAINVVIDEARDNINRRNALLASDLNKSIEKAKHDVNEKNKAIAYDIKSTVEDMNEQIRNTSTLKMILNKKKINLRVPTDDLLKPFDFDFDVEQLLSGQALELDAAEILKEVMLLYTIIFGILKMVLTILNMMEKQ